MAAAVAAVAAAATAAATAATAAAAAADDIDVKAKAENMSKCVRCDEWCRIFVAYHDYEDDDHPDAHRVCVDCYKLEPYYDYDRFKCCYCRDDFDYNSDYENIIDDQKLKLIIEGLRKKMQTKYDKYKHSENPDIKRKCGELMSSYWALDKISYLVNNLTYDCSANVKFTYKYIMYIIEDIRETRVVYEDFDADS